MRTQDGIASAIASAKLAGCGASVFDGLHAAVRGAWLSLVLWSAYATAATQPAASKAAREVPGRWKHVRTPTTAFRNPVCLAPASNTLRHAVDVRRKRKLAAMVTHKGCVCNMCGICFDGRALVALYWPPLHLLNTDRNRARAIASYFLLIGHSVRAHVHCRAATLSHASDPPTPSRDLQLLCTQHAAGNHAFSRRMVGGPTGTCAQHTRTVWQLLHMAALFEARHTMRALPRRKLEPEPPAPAASWNQSITNLQNRLPRSLVLAVIHACSFALQLPRVCA